MSRLPLTFACDGELLVASLDTAPGSNGLLLVSGGNEIRAGAFSGQSALAGRVAKAGFPVFRFDRRGIGDSGGENRGFRRSSDDISAAIQAFRAMAPNVDRIVGFGNCDAASALMLAEGGGCDSLVLSNPWTIEDGDEDQPPPDAVRARYLDKLKRPSEIARLLRGGVNMRKLASGLRQAARPKAAPTSLAQDMRSGIAGFPGRVEILIATEDRTAQMFENRWNPDDERIQRCDGASHAYVEPHARDWLFERLLAALRKPNAA